MRIFTGAPVPDGADTVVIQENTDATAAWSRCKRRRRAGHIRAARLRTSATARCCFAPAARLGPRELMLAAAMNHAELPVRRQPQRRHPRHRR